MGQAKHNPIAILAKEGKIPPKPRKMGVRESERLLEAGIQYQLLKALFKPRKGGLR